MVTTRKVGISLGITVILLISGCLAAPTAQQQNNELTQPAQAVAAYEEAYISANMDTQNELLTDDAFIHKIGGDPLPHEVNSVSEINTTEYTTATNISLADDWTARSTTALIAVDITDYGFEENRTKYYQVQQTADGWKVDSVVVREDR